MNEETSSQQPNAENAPHTESLAMRQTGPEITASGNATNDSVSVVQPAASARRDEQPNMQNDNRNASGDLGNVTDGSARVVPARLAKNQPHRVGGNQRPVQLRSEVPPEKAGEKKVPNPASLRTVQDGGAFSSQFSNEQIKSNAAKHAKSGVERGAESGKLRLTAAEFEDPTEPLGTSSSLLPLGDQVNGWTSQLMHNHFLLLQCPDENVLRSAGHAIANGEAFASWSPRALRFGPWRSVLEAKRALTTDLPETTFKMLVHDKMTPPGARKLIVVFGYMRTSESFLDTLPQNRDEIEALDRRMRDAIRHDSLRIVVLATPYCLRVAGQQTPFSQDYALPPLDFLTPLLNNKFPEPEAQRIESDLRQQFEKNLWGDDEEAFHKSVCSFLNSNKLEAEIESRAPLMKEADPKAALTQRQADLSRDMLGDGAPLENALIFAATYFEDLPADDLQRVLVNLLGDRTMDIPVPAPAAVEQSSSSGNASPVLQTRPKLLRQIWSEDRQAILKKCRLRILDGNPPVVGFESVDLRDSLQRRLESEFFFLFDDLCERVMATRLFFDNKDSVSESVGRLVVRRIKNDPSGYGQTFLFSLVLPLAPNAHAANEGTLEGLRSTLAGLSDDRRRDLLHRLGTLLNSLVEEQAFLAIDRTLRILLDLGRHDDVLVLLSWMIHPSFLTRRVEVLRRIVNEGTPETRHKVGRHLAHWVRTGGSRTATLLQALHGWCNNSNTPSAAVGMQFFVQLCALCVLPPAIWETHTVAFALTATESETGFQEIASWLLSLDASSAKYLNTEEGLDWLLDPDLGNSEEMQYVLALTMTFLWIMPRGAEDELLPAVLGSSTLSQAILNVWFSSYERALMAGLPGSMPPAAESSSTWPRPLPGWKRVNGQLSWPIGQPWQSRSATVS